MLLLCRVAIAALPGVALAQVRVGPGTQIKQVSIEFEGEEPQALLEWAFERFGGGVAISTSFQIDSVVLIDMAKAVGVPFRVFSLDTGRLHPDTYQFIEKVRSHYGIPITTMFPQPDAVETLVRDKGLFSFYTDGHKECCSIRKVEQIVREELNRDGCQELLMPTVQPKELWEESGRWKLYGRELLRMKDRKDADFCLGPTHEEVITEIVRK